MRDSKFCACISIGSLQCSQQLGCLFVMVSVVPIVLWWQMSMISVVLFASVVPNGIYNVVEGHIKVR